MLYKAAGCLIYSVSTERFCLQLRKNKKANTNSWGTWGGQLEQNEKPMDGMLREIQEELSRDIQISKIIHLNTYRNKDFSYTNYIMLVRNEFIPTLNSESDGYSWVNIHSIPTGLHHGTKRLFETAKIRKKIEKITGNYNINKALYDYIKRNESGS